MFVGIGFICVPCTVLIYRQINAKRDRMEKELEESGEKRETDDEIRALGDRALHFRYTL